MNRRSFFKRLSKAAVAVVATPTAIKFLLARKNLAAAVVAPTKVVPFWFQTTRRSRCVDAAYAEFMRKMQPTFAKQAAERPFYVSASPERITTMEGLYNWAMQNSQLRA